MNPGELDRQIKLYLVTEERSASGEVIPGEAYLFTIPAKFVPQRESRAPSDGAQSRVKGVVTYYIRWLSRFEPGQTITAYELEERGVRYRIDSVIELGRRNVMQIDCETIDQANR